MAGEKHSILGIGAAILDHILYVDDDFLSTIPGRKGGMEPIDITTFTDILRRYKSETKLIPGGSAANVIRGLSNLGHRCAFHCKVGQDKAADLFLEDLKRQNVLPISNKSKTETAQVLSLVTPDGQRTCRTFLGASVEMCGRDLHAEEFKDASLVHIEGYSLTRNNLVLEAMRQAKAAGAKISFDLASFEIVENYKDFIFELASNYVDVLQLRSGSSAPSICTTAAPR
jgi:sugar/nucleoside kinase (ribokinase family)